MTTNHQFVPYARIVTAGTDNTIRVWDSKDMGLVNVLNNHHGVEISFMVYCEYSNVIITGHVNSQLIMWNIDSNHCILFDQKCTLFYLIIL